MFFLSLLVGVHEGCIPGLFIGRDGILVAGGCALIFVRGGWVYVNLWPSHNMHAPMTPLCVVGSRGFCMTIVVPNRACHEVPICHAENLQPLRHATMKIVNNIVNATFVITNLLPTLAVQLFVPFPPVMSPWPSTFLVCVLCIRRHCASLHIILHEEE